MNKIIIKHNIFIDISLKKKKKKVQGPISAAINIKKC